MTNKSLWNEGMFEWTRWCFNIYLSFVLEIQSQDFQDWILQFPGNMHHDPISLLSQLRGLMVCIRTSCIGKCQIPAQQTFLYSRYHCLHICYKAEWVLFWDSGAFVKARIWEWNFRNSVNIHWESILYVRLC